jgi:hypothetical protein
MIQKASAICVILLLCACGGGSKGDGTISSATSQMLVSSNGDKLKYVGNWSSCMPQSTGQFNGNNISFSSDGADLIFIPAIGIVGSFYDSICTKAVPGEAMGVSPIAGLHFSSIKTIAITLEPLMSYRTLKIQLSNLLALALITKAFGFHRRFHLTALSFDMTRNKSVPSCYRRQQA